MQTDFAIMTEDLHDEIDELAMTVEQQIAMNEHHLEELPEFDPKYRRMEENAEAIFG